MDQRSSSALHIDAAARGSDYVGKYRILGELGRGSMGVVYRGFDDALGRDVALKSPLASDASEDDCRRFLHEARAASRVSHPHLVPVYDVFEEGGRPWLAMEFVEGRTLRDTLKAPGRLPLEDTLLLGEQIAEALDAVHGRGLLHGDVKPGNIMVASHGNARLMDFGLARFVAPPHGPGPALEASANVLQDTAGTLGYTSPEQILGRPLEPSSDIFALGAVLYEAATGRRAFAGETPGELFDATLHLTPPAMGELAREAPGELQRIVSKALAKRPDERYQSAKELAADLRTLRRRLESQHHTPPARPAERPRPWPAFIGAVVVLAAIVTVWRWYEGRRPAAVELGSPQQLTAASGWQAEPAVAPDGALVADPSSESGNADLWLLDLHGGAAVRLTDDAAADRSPAWFPDGSGLAFVSDRRGRPSIWRISRLGGSPSFVIEDAEDPAVSPNGLTVAFARRDASGFFRICVAPFANPDQVRVLTTQQAGLWDHRKPSWSPDGQTIVYHAARNLWAVTATGANPRPLTSADAADKEPVWSPDGRFIYFSSNREGTRALWRIPASGGPAVRLTGGQGPERQPSLSLDGSRLVYSTFVDDTDLVIRDLKSGRERRFGGEQLESSPVFSPDGRSLAFVSTRWIGHYDLWLQPLNANTNEPEGVPRRLTDQSGSVEQPAFSPDGRWIAYHRVLDGQRDVWIVSASGGAPVQFTSDPASDVEPDWSPDGRFVVFVSDRDGTSQVWVAPVLDGRPAGPARRLTGGPGGISTPTWSPEGATIAFAGGDSDVWVIAADGRSPARRLTRGADVWKLSWNRTTGALWANGSWGADTLSFRIIDVKSGAVRQPDLPIAGLTPPTTFDVSWDGRRIAFVRQELRGHLWVQKFLAGAF